MKKILVLLVLGFSMSGIAQETEPVSFKKNELKINAAYLIAEALEVSYERVLNEESAFGASLFLPLANYIDIKLMFTPYYRYYFGKKPAAGFFAEGFGMLNNYESDSPIENSNGIDFALGFGLGGKWITKKGFIFEINGGIGRNLFNGSDINYKIVGRGGITFGYRFN
ncbi:DUF3575 domain-containing protein [Flavobacterium sp.]|jgi:hypothetical protein|uniref:DUF3575 domain-containing protein n=1 Tax=Flavobacterium sp. TaxID=239 RepID=UPI0022CA141F|nr:DUF3575 domain-containing protein [Flavobacterium sp.]MCZ8228055.1 DUF3575 domain-containing protein [Flavobacterium sp.]